MCALYLWVEYRLADGWTLMAPELERYDGPGRGVRRPAARASLWGQSPARHARGQTGKSGTEDGLGLFPGRDILSKRREGGSNMGAKDITVEQFKGTWANYSNRRIEPGNKQDLCYSMRWIIMDVWQKIIR